MTTPLKTRHVLRLLSRADVASLTPAQRAQLVAAGPVVLGRAKTLDDILAWSDKEQLGWTLIALERDGGRVMDVWMLSNLDDGAVFEADSADYLGIGVSQTSVNDEHESRDALVSEIQAALDAYDSPVPYEDWKRG